jgi:hypothetical protein
VVSPLIHLIGICEFTESFNPNGFIIKEIAAGPKKLFQVDYNYYIFNFIGVSDIIDICEPYYADFALLSEQIINDADCIIDNYEGNWF